MPNKKVLPLTTVEAAYNFALRKLDMRDYGQKEMEGKLRERGCPSPVIREVMDKLLEYKLINEEKYGEKVYSYWLSKKYYGSKHLRQTLAQKQVKAELAAELLAQFTPEQELEHAQAFARVNYPKYQKKYGAEQEKAKAALARALATRGFSGGCISKILANLPSTRENGHDLF